MAQIPGKHNARSLPEELAVLIDFTAGELVETIIAVGDRRGVPVHVDNSVGVMAIAVLLLEKRDLSKLVLDAMAARLGVSLVPVKEGE